MSCVCGRNDFKYVLRGGTSFSADIFEDLFTFEIDEKWWFYTRTKADQHSTIDNVSDDNDDPNSNDNVFQSDDGYLEARRCQSTVLICKVVWVFGEYDGDMFLEMHSSWTCQQCRGPGLLWSCSSPCTSTPQLFLLRGRW